MKFKGRVRVRGHQMLTNVLEGCFQMKATDPTSTSVSEGLAWEMETTFRCFMQCILGCSGELNSVSHSFHAQEC